MDGGQCGERVEGLASLVEVSDPSLLYGGHVLNQPRSRFSGGSVVVTRIINEKPGQQ